MGGKFKYTLEEVIASARRYKTRWEWQRKDGKLYFSGRAQGLLNDPRVTGHMPKNTTLLERCIYMFYGKNSNECYIGLTCNLEIRLDQHRTSKRWQDLETRFGEVIYKKLYNFVPEEKAQELEKYYIDSFRDGGWNVLNKVKGGSLGGCRRKWTLALCKEDALKYSTKREWYKNSRAAEGAACRYGWYKECTSHMVTERKWSLENTKKLLKEEGITTIKDFKTRFESGYCRATQQGFLKDLNLASNPYPKGPRKWKKCKCKIEAAKYKTSANFRTRCCGGWSAAKRYGWLEEFFPLECEDIKEEN